MFWTIVYFFVLIYFLGSPVVQLVTGRLRLRLEMHVLSTGIGLATFTVVTVLLNTMRLPLVWWMFLIVAALLQVSAVLRCRRKTKPAGSETRPGSINWKEVICLLIALGLAGVNCGVYLNGSLKARWLCDDDPWYHAASAKHVATTRTYALSVEEQTGIMSYLEPYPPGYPSLMGVLHQLNNSIFLTLKVFNIVVIALGIVWFYLMMREWTQRPAAALWMTGALWVLPCFMSRFIWAQSMALVLFFPAFYAFERTRREPAWAIVAAVCTGGVLLSQPSSAAIFALFAVVYWLVNAGVRVFAGEQVVSTRTLVHQALAGLGGLLISALFYLTAFLKFGYAEFMMGVAKINVKTAPVPLKVTGTGHADVYSLWDLIHAPVSTKINQPVGIGPVLFVLACAGVVLIVARWRHLREERWGLVALLWLLISVLGVMGNRLPFALFPHRFWVFLAIPVAMAAGAFMTFIGRTLDWKHLAPAAAAGVLLGIVLAATGVAAGLAERLDGPDGSTVGTIITVGATIVGLLAMVLFWAAELPEAMKKLMRAVMAGLIVFGVILTSGYVKARFEGFSPYPWPPGVHFFTFVAQGPDGRPILIRQHLAGYVAIREKAFRPNSRFLVLTAPGNQLIGFDMFTLPYDLDVRRLREDFDALKPNELDETFLARIREVARTKKLHYLLVDTYPLALLQYRLRLSQRKPPRVARSMGIGEERFKALAQGTAAPTEAEKPLVAIMHQAAKLHAKYTTKGRDATLKLARLRQMLEASPVFKRTFNSGPQGVVVYWIRQPTVR